MSAPHVPPISDRLPVALRAFAEQNFRELKEPRTEFRERSVAGASCWTLIFDTETTVHPGQALRFGTYQFRNGEVLDEAGIFYDPDGVSADELATLKRYADANGFRLRTRDEFADQVFYARAWTLRATIAGFNLPFDLSRIAIRYGSAKSPIDSKSGTMHGAFTFRLSNQKIYPNVRVKHLSRKAALISFAAPMKQMAGRGHRNRGLSAPTRRGHFIDVATIANAIFARGFSLAGLSDFLGIENPKLDFGDFDGPVTEEMARYAMRDVQATWECHVELMKRFDRLGLTGTIPEKIYSEAGIGKGYLKEMGIVPWREVQPEFPRQLLGKIMGSYFGGRSEIRIRREMRQVILCDFLSMYPTVCTLMGLWRFVIAEGMTWRDATAETKALLKSVDLAALQSQPIWAQLSTLVRVLPKGDIFPVRAAYSGEAQTTIGANYLTSDTPLWFTLADCIAAKLLTGKTPKIIEAISFAPGPVQAGLSPIDISGNPDYHVDPAVTDFFKRVIELRQSIKKRRDAATGEERDALDTEQNALKIAANATSYGVYVEVNVDTRPHRKSLTVLSSTCEPFSFETDKAEMPGRYFHPLLATLITGAARLMLATAERLIADAGLEWSFCDTDSMAIAKPIDMGSDKFAESVEGIVDWFAALNPYSFGGSILKIEDVNASLEIGDREPLYCWAISSKRYALFNLSADGSPIMRKVSAHGLGHLLPPYRSDDAPADIPTPDPSVLGKGIERWHSDLWYRIVSAELAGHADQVRLDYHRALASPAISRYAATTPELLRWFSSYNADRAYRHQVKPFGFLLSLSVKLDFGGESLVTKAKRGRPRRQFVLKPIAPFDSDYAKALELAFDRETGAPVTASLLKSYADALCSYHIQPESKFLNADYSDRGVTQRRHVEMITTHHIGKESHDWERQAMIGLNAESEIAYGMSQQDRVELSGELRAFIGEYGLVKAAKSLNVRGIDLRALADGSNRESLNGLASSVAAQLAAAIKFSETAREKQCETLYELQLAVTRDGLRETARKLGIDPSNLRRRLISGGETPKPR